jgi:hypothetical protein
MPPPPPPGPTEPPLFAPIDPGRDGWGPLGPPSASSALFFNVDLGFLRPALKNRLHADVPTPEGGSVTIDLPSADLEWTVSPTLEIGYRLCDSLGFLSVSYRFLVSQDSTTLPNDISDFQVRTRVDVNAFDFDYGTTPYSFAPRWDVTSRIGIRLADVYFDSKLQNAFISEQESSNFYGAGPHVRFDFNRHIAVAPGLSLFGRIDGAVLIGQINQRFRDTFLDADLGLRRTQSVPTLTLQAGLSYTPPTMSNLHLTTGYQFERWWYLGQLGPLGDGTQPASRGELTTQGIFLRAEIDF